ncbi:hypothetical protein [Streptomyces chartreusis]|uniref:hypothetical protein n=1 Tax=Streptomyces chartreusis TaxID=1969 RepID=UPI0036421C3E
MSDELEDLLRSEYDGQLDIEVEIHRLRQANEALRHGGAESVGVSGEQVELTGRSAGPTRFAYQRQVEMIAPLVLEGRESELADFAHFCTAEDGQDYLFVQGPAWAGKSALLAWFAVNPPAGVVVVPFFITARLAGHSDRQAFLDVVLEQLAEIVGQPLPTQISSYVQAEYFYQLFNEAAQACRQSGQILVLLVDGLDEDTGITEKLSASSIAALLPMDPPAGARVLVSGRPHSSLPSDVPERHPLRGSAIAYHLRASEYAQGLRVDASRELKDLLSGAELPHRILGFLVAAGGGLSLRDLSELARYPVRQVQLVVASRTFSVRNSQWQSESGRDIVMLAHEELVENARNALGDKRLTEYREALNRWASQYRQQGWPASTPEYLLQGYFNLLLATGNRSAAFALVADQSRQDRILAASGGDASSLEEIGRLQAAIAEDSEPDLKQMLMLAINRDKLKRRNSNIPSNLPAAWAALGNSGRAVALAYSITAPDRHMEALSGLVKAWVSAGELERAKQAAYSLRDHRRQVRVMTELIQALAESKHIEQARQVAREVAHLVELIDVPGQRASGLADLVTCLAVVGELDQAEQVAQEIPDPFQRSQALASLVRYFALAGQEHRARSIANHAEGTARSIPVAVEEAQTSPILIETLAATGDLGRAESLARSITDPSRQAWALISLVEVVTRSGDLAKAEEIAHTITDPDQRSAALAELVRAMATAGWLERAQVAADSITAPLQKARALVEIADRADPTTARKLLAHALLIGPFEIAVSSLAKVESVVDIIEAESQLPVI